MIGGIMKKITVLVVSLFFAFNLYAQDRGLKVVAETNLGNRVNIGKQYALFIAIDAYREWTPLKKPVSDAKEIRDILKTDYYIDEVIELYNEQATRQNIIKTFTDLQNKLSVHDSLFIYYAGHGYLENGSGQGFWIPVDGGTDITKQDNWLVNSQIRGYISRFKTIHVFLVSDSCFSGDLLIASRSAAPQIDNEYLRKAYTFTSRQVMTSGASEQVPDQSEFSAAFINTLRKNTDPLLCPSDIFPDLRRSVRKTMPMFGPLADARHQDGAEFIFFRRQTSVAVTPNENVYIVGTDGGDAVYWLNGKKNILPKTEKKAFTTAIAVSGSNLYITGVDGDDAVYWLNGQKNVLQKTKKWANTTAIVIAGTNVYITGYEYDENGADAVYWLNGKKNVLPKTGDYSEANAIAVSGSNVYIVGNEHHGDAVYWLNGRRNVLPKTGDSAKANAIAVSGSNVYIVGYDEVYNENNDNASAVYWLNGKRNVLQTAGKNASAEAVAISGSNVYIVGYEKIINRGTNYVEEYTNGVYWLNGKRTVLPKTESSRAFAISVLGSNVYNVGFDASFDTGYDAVYWLNGQKYVLQKTGSSAFAHSIMVTN